MENQKVWTKEQIVELLKTNETAVLRGIVAIYNYQTKTEQDSNQTIEHNGIGFSGVDGGILGSFAKQIIKSKKLSIKQFAIAKNKMPKYAGQLAKISNHEM